MSRCLALRRGIGLCVIAGVLVLLTGEPAPGQATNTRPSSGTALPVPTERWTGDLDQMIKRRFIRILVAHSKTFFCSAQAS
jgi:hypothetical protein